MSLTSRRTVMARKRYKPEEIVAKLRQVDVLVSQGQNMVDAIRQIGVSEVTYYRWRQEFGGLKTEQVKRLKDLELENSRLRKAVPMALDENSGRVLVAFRNPAQLGVFSMQDGSAIATVDACGDADDLFVDAKRQRGYLSCGDGYLDVFEAQ